MRRSLVWDNSRSAPYAKEKMVSQSNSPSDSSVPAGLPLPACQAVRTRDKYYTFIHRTWSISKKWRRSFSARDAPVSSVPRNQGSKYMPAHSFHASGWLNLPLWIRSPSRDETKSTVRLKGPVGLSAVVGRASLGSIFLMTVRTALASAV